MSRPKRLLDLVQLLRQYRHPVTGQRLAEQLGISLRTLYRDIQTLQSHGATIEGEAGIGYVLRSGFMLPPLMFTEEEIEALVLGSRWVEGRADPSLRKGAKSALAKIGAVLPSDLKDALDGNTLLIGPAKNPVENKSFVSALRDSIRTEQKVSLRYRDLRETESHRVVWPFAIGYFEDLAILVAWCELREDFRNFRTDRILTANRLAHRYPKRRAELLKNWRKQQKFSTSTE
jgi:predicted DNA-binding transcriptional regulator YafY